MVHFIVCRKLEGYKFPVYSTVVCPKNEAEWEKRSSALMCSEENAYMCLPNEHFTELLEFCYTESRTLIEEGLCLYLIKDNSLVNDYNCKNFRYGCPTSPYLSSRIFDYPSCVHIENGCFLTEPNCKSAKPTYTPKTTTDIQFENGLNDSITTISQETTKKIQLEMNPINDKKNWNLVAIIVLGTFVPICLILVTYIYFKKRASHENYTENLESRKKKKPWRRGIEK